MEYPYLGARWLYGRRRLTMRRFPYYLAYVIVDDEIVVMAMAHNNRRPDFWRDRE